LKELVDNEFVLLLSKFLNKLVVYNRFALPLYKNSN